MTTNGEHSSLETCDRPDAWLCDLTLQETATEPMSTTAVSVTSTPVEFASPAGLIATAVADTVCGVQMSANSGPISGIAAPVEAPRRLRVRASDQGFCRSRSIIITCCSIDWPGTRADKRGAIPEHLAPIVKRLGLNQSNWVETVRDFGRLFKQAAGRSSLLVDPRARGLFRRGRERARDELLR